MEYLPDFTAGVQYDDYLVPSFAPIANEPRDWVGSIGFNLPVFFWLKQDEDVARAKANLQAARSDQALIKIQAAAAVATLFRSAQFCMRRSGADQATSRVAAGGSAAGSAGASVLSSPRVLAPPLTQPPDCQTGVTILAAHLRKLF
jgi:hypothetical protein